MTEGLDDRAYMEECTTGGPELWAHALKPEHFTVVLVHQPPIPRVLPAPTTAMPSSTSTSVAYSWKHSAASTARPPCS